jgi:hypothetical protein
MSSAGRSRAAVGLTGWSGAGEPTAAGQLGRSGCAAGRDPLGSGVMRPSRMLLLGLAGLVAVHVFMLAGHGSGHGTPAVGVSGSAEHAASSPSPPSGATPDEEGHSAVDLTVACLAVLAGLVLLGLRRAAQAATAGQGQPAARQNPSRLRRAGPRTRSLAELCISLT